MHCAVFLKKFDQWRRKIRGRDKKTMDGGTIKTSNVVFTGVFVWGGVAIL